MTRHHYVTLAALAVLSTAGCGKTEPEQQVPAEMVYFDRATKKPVVAAAGDEVPAKHPVTGKRTLVPALYCSKCKNWYPAPPLDLQQRDPNARNCPRHKIPMTMNGPRPQ